MSIGEKTVSRKEFLSFEFDHKDGVLTGELSVLEGLHSLSLNDLIDELKRLSKDKLYHLEESKVSDLKISCQLKVALQCCFLFKRKDLYRNIPLHINSLYVPGIENKDLQKAKRIKVKIGRNDLEKEIRLINQLIKSCSNETRFRLDANRSLTKEQLENFWIGISSKESIEYFEEPLTSFKDLLALKDIPIALDENLEKSIKDKNIPSQVTSFVVKPGLNFDFRQIEQLMNFRKKIILSSAYETPFTLACFCVFIHENQELKKQYHGLDTMNAFACQKSSFTHTSHGSIFLIP